MNVYDEIVEFIASRNPQEVADFQPSEAASQRFWGLIEAEKEGRLNEADRAELDRAMELEHLMRLAKARARLLLTHGQ